MIKRPNSKANRDQILAAFDALNAEYKKLESQVGSKSAPEISYKESTVKGAKASESVEVSEQSIDQIIASLSGLRANFGGAVNALSAKLSAEAQQLAILRHDAATITQQLSELHGLTVTDDALGKVIREYDQTAESFKKEMLEKREAFDKEMANKLKLWKEEQDLRAQAIAERQDASAKARARTQTEYEYDLQQRRKTDEDAYQLARKVQKQQLDEQVALRQKAWADKEKIIVEQEKLYTDYKAKHDEIPAKLGEALKKARGEGAGIAAAQAKIKADLLNKEIEGERRVSELKIKSLEQAIKERQTQVETLSSQLAAALKQGQELAVKAIEGASGANSFMAVKEIALEQAKNSPKNK